MQATLALACVGGVKFHMSHYGTHPPISRATEPVDANVWHWFICNGPHGERFEWQQTSPRIKRDIEFLKEFIEQKESANPGFINNARIIALEALDNENPVIVFTGIQVLTVVGKNDDFIQVQKLVSHSDERVVKNAKAAIFERGIKKVRKNET